jgi:glutamine synthetase
MFLQEGPHGTSILYVPSVFISYNGEALDEKTVLLRSSEVLAKATMELLDMLAPTSEGTVVFILWGGSGKGRGTATIFN